VHDCAVLELVSGPTVQWMEWRLTEPCRATGRGSDDGLRARWRKLGRLELAGGPDTQHGAQRRVALVASGTPRPGLRGRSGSALMLQWTWFVMILNQGSSCIPHLRNARENSLSKRGMCCRLRARWKHRRYQQRLTANIFYHALAAQGSVYLAIEPLKRVN
jgi:hypothetical protein